MKSSSSSSSSSTDGLSFILEEDGDDIEMLKYVVDENNRTIYEVETNDTTK